MNQVRIYRDFPLTATSGDFLIYVSFITAGLGLLAFCYYYFFEAALLFFGYYLLKFALGRVKALRLHQQSRQLDAYRVAILGSGLAGIDAAIHCKRNGIPFVMFEKNAQVRERRFI
jgi:NADPH-dependent 2,4-dienoyl-CoA reductase/sulfur reductase-like enzyme